MKENNGYYSKIGNFYDIFDYPSELLYYKSMRKHWISKVRNEHVLELGVGTGKNLPYYHHSNFVIGLDRERNMLRHAANRVRKNQVTVNISLTLQEMLPWKLPKSKFSLIVATFVFCTMINPKPILQELDKWVDKGTKLLIFEYVRPNNGKSQSLIKFLNPLTTKFFGVNFNRKPTHDYLENNWKIIKRTDVVKDFIIVIEALKT